MIGFSIWFALWIQYDSSDHERANPKTKRRYENFKLFSKKRIQNRLLTPRETREPTFQRKYFWNPFFIVALWIFAKLEILKFHENPKCYYVSSRIRLFFTKNPGNLKFGFFWYTRYFEPELSVFRRSNLWNCRELLRIGLQRD